MDNRIIQKLNEDINRVLNEELGIADDVKNATNTIYNRIVEEYKNKKYQEDKLIDDGVGQKYGNFYMDDIFGYKLFVEYYIINFRDNFYRNKYIKKNGKNYLDSFSNIKFIKNRKKPLLSQIIVIIESLSGKIINIETAKDSIQHELEHIYQQTKMGKEFGGTDLYNLASSDLNGKNKYRHSIGIIVYMSFKNEIEGFANGLYSFVVERMKSYPININKIFQESPAYEKLQQVYEAIDFINSHMNDTEMNNAFSDYILYKVNKNNINKIADYAVDEMLSRFGKALIKARQDAMDYGVRGENYLRQRFM